MLYRQRIDVFIRRYENIGHIYNAKDGSDRVFNDSGAIFLSALSRTPQSFDDIVKRICTSFIDAEPAILANDVLDFLAMLENDGFIVSGNTASELTEKDAGFDYSQIKTKENYDSTFNQTSYAKKDSSRFLENHFKLFPHLTSFQIELSSRCNERCVHCYIPHERKNTDIDPALFSGIIEQCRELGILNLTLSGGEPMIHRNFPDFLRQLRDYDFSVAILSNLTLLDDEILSALKSNPNCRVQVSLYSMKPEVHDSITMLPGSFDKTYNAVIKLIENNVRVYISCPTMKQNKACYSDVLKWAQGHNVQALTDYIMMARYDHTKDNLDNRLSLDDIEKIIKLVMSNNEEYSNDILSDDFYERINRNRADDSLCGAGISSMCMDAKGNCYPCPGWQEFKVGSTKESSLKEIWTNSPRINYLRNLCVKDFHKCNSCPDFAFCSPCMVRNANENPEADPLKINDHFCKVAALNRKIVLDWKAKLQNKGVSF
jgi:radical SAM protein with 4Fe4S-binding SPASM domain